MKTLQQDLVVTRRQRVASLRNKGLTHEEIWAMLAFSEDARVRMVNPDTGEPYDRTTITRDLQHNRRQALKASQIDSQQMLANQLSEIREMRRSAWLAGNLPMVARGLDQEMKLTGTVNTGINITVNIALVQQLIDTLQTAGYDPSSVFNDLIAEVAESEIGPASAET